MNWLCWDEERGAFVGRRLIVSAHAFQAAVDTAVANGVPEHEAILELLQEEAWSSLDAGVTLLSVPPPPIELRRRCRPPRHRRG